MATVVEVVSATPTKHEAAAKEEVIEPEPEAVKEKDKEQQIVSDEEVPAPVIVAEVEPDSEEKEVKEAVEIVEEEEKEQVSEPKGTSKVAPEPVIEEEKAVVADSKDSDVVVASAVEIKEGGQGEGEEEAPAAEKAE